MSDPAEDPFGDDLPAAFLDAVALLEQQQLQQATSEPALPVAGIDQAPQLPANPTYVEIELEDSEGKTAEASTRHGLAAAVAEGGQPPPVVSDLTDIVDEELSAADTPPPPKSLFSLFRSRRGYLSVTDLCAPVWCEVQYDYGLRGKRFLPVSQRPTTFVSGRGATITPNVAQAEVNAKIMDAGSAVHKKLEREIHPVEVKVDVTTREETWGLRLLNMLANIEALIELGICREMPVMGLINGHLVVGVIDEIQRRPLETAAKCPSPASAVTPRPPSPASLPPPPLLNSSKPRSLRARGPEMPPLSSPAPNAGISAISQPDTPSARKGKKPLKPIQSRRLSLEGSQGSSQKQPAQVALSEVEPDWEKPKALPKITSFFARKPKPPPSSSDEPIVLDDDEEEEVEVQMLPSPSRDGRRSPPPPAALASAFKVPPPPDATLLTVLRPSPLHQGQLPPLKEDLVLSALALPASPDRRPPQVASSASAATLSPPPVPIRPHPQTSPNTPFSSPPTHALFVSDSKTRRSYSLPRDDATLPGRLQCQIYKLLLDNLLAPTATSALAALTSQPEPAEQADAKSTTSLALLFTYLELDAGASFSDGFCVQAQELIEGNAIQIDWSDGRPLTLSLLAAAWERAVGRLGIDREKGVDETLSLVYRYQSPFDKPARAGRGKGKRKSTGGSSGAGEVVALTEEEQLQLAIQRSLNVGRGDDGPDGDQAPQLDVVHVSDIDRELQRAVELSLAVDNRPPTPPPADPPAHAGTPTGVNAVPGHSSSPIRSPSSSQPGATRAVQVGAVDAIDDGPVEVAEGAVDPPPSFEATSRASRPAPLRSASSTVLVEALLQADIPTPLSPPPPPPPPPEPPSTPSKKDQVDELMRLKLPELRRLAGRTGVETWGAKNVLADRIVKARITKARSTAQVPASSSSQPQPVEKRAKTMPSVKDLPAPGGPVFAPVDSAAAYRRSDDDDIIGVKTFPFSRSDLDAHLSNVLAFWHGDRPPVGVGEADTWKCNSCELRESCEWRAEEAERIWDERRVGRVTQAAPKGGLVRF